LSVFLTKDLVRLGEDRWWLAKGRTGRGDNLLFTLSGAGGADVGGSVSLVVTQQKKGRGAEPNNGILEKHFYARAKVRSRSGRNESCEKGLRRNCLRGNAT